ncbi:MAG: bifunctional methylenetetrahydrofolate dehydrogenase/methenyltetrahydrofolate cyclohydrolase FolD [Janthinobacterium lividum]
MSAYLLDGRACADRLKQDLVKRLGQIQKNTNMIPGLAVIQVGDNPASQVYVASKIRQCHEVGIRSFLYTFKADVSQDHVLDKIYQLNQDPQIHGILIQLPLPPHLESTEIINALDPLKDVDGLHRLNLGALVTGAHGTIPCTPRGCLTLIKQYRQDLTGLTAVVLGRSLLVGKPMALILLGENCTVVMAHSKTQNLPDICGQADILVVAVGLPQLVKKSWVKPGAIVLDVGINRLTDNILVGDVDFDNVKDIAGAITPVPGGIGPMTVVSLLQNTVDLICHQIGYCDACEN